MWDDYEAARRARRSIWVGRARWYVFVVSSMNASVSLWSGHARAPGRVPWRSPLRVSRRANACLTARRSLVFELADASAGCVATWRRGIWQ